MPSDTPPVNVLEQALELGLPLPVALSHAAGMSLSALAGRIGVRREELSMCVNAIKGRGYPRIREDLASYLGCERDRVDGWIEAEALRRSTASPEQDSAAA